MSVLHQSSLKSRSRPSPDNAHPSAQLLYEAFGAGYAPSLVEAYDRWQHDHRDKSLSPIQSIAIVAGASIAARLLESVLLRHDHHLLPSRPSPSALIPPCHVLRNPNLIPPCNLAGIVTGLLAGFPQRSAESFSLPWVPTISAKEGAASTAESDRPLLEQLQQRTCAPHPWMNSVLWNAESLEINAYEATWLTKAQSVPETEALHSLSMLIENIVAQLDVKSKYNHGAWASHLQDWALAVIEQAQKLAAIHDLGEMLQDSLSNPPPAPELYRQGVDALLEYLDKVVQLKQKTKQDILGLQLHKESLNLQHLSYSALDNIANSRFLSDHTYAPPTIDGSSPLPCLEGDLALLHESIARGLLIEASNAANLDSLDVALTLLPRLRDFITDQAPRRIKILSRNASSSGEQQEEQQQRQRHAAANELRLWQRITETLVAQIEPKAVRVSTKAWAYDHFSRCYLDHEDHACQSHPDPYLQSWHSYTSENLKSYGDTLIIKPDAPHWPSVILPKPQKAPWRCFSLGKQVAELTGFFPPDSDSKAVVEMETMAAAEAEAEMEAESKAKRLFVRSLVWCLPDS